jgi:hypothetical protein
MLGPALLDRERDLQHNSGYPMVEGPRMRHIPKHPGRALSRAIVATLAVGALTLGALASPLAAQRPLGVDVWFAGGNDFDRGAMAPLRFSADPGTNVAIVRVDGDGRFSVLWPVSPSARATWRGGQTETQVPFRADATDGVGYVFAIASRTPFDFRMYRSPSGDWNVGSFASRVGVDPFELVDRFARNITGPRGEYTIAYAPYQTGSGDYHVRNGYASGAVYPPGDAYGYDAYPNGAYVYDAYDGYDVGYGYGGAWLGSPYYRQFRNYRFPALPFSNDPRARALRHCPDGTLAPYTAVCPPLFGRGRNGGVIRAVPGASDGGLRLLEQRRRFDGARDRIRTGVPSGGGVIVRGVPPAPRPTPAPRPAPPPPRPSSPSRHH